MVDIGTWLSKKIIFYLAIIVCTIAYCLLSRIVIVLIDRKVIGNRKNSGKLNQFN